MNKIRCTALLMLLTSMACHGATYYVATNGNNNNSGTQASPFATLQKGHDVAVAGDTIFMRGGTYTFAPTVINRDGASGNTIKIFNFPGETPIIDGASNSTGSNSYPIYLQGANWIHIKGIDIRNGKEGGLRADASSNNIFEFLSIHNNGRFSVSAAGKGLSIFLSSSNNLILNVDSYGNEDPNGDNADGIFISAGGTGNVVRGSRVWRNSDDGFDAFCVTGTCNCKPILFENNWAFENGMNEAGQSLGNGNGFKLGGTTNGQGCVSGGNLVNKNKSFNNKSGGFDNNVSSAPSADRRGNVINNNTSANNGSNYTFFTQDSTNVSTLKNNISFGNFGNIDKSIHSFNSFDLSVIVNSADFQPDDHLSCAKSARQADGSLPNCTFFNLVAGSDLIDKGTNVGLPFSGSAPDLGAFEFALGGDPTPPTVAITAPSSGATVTGIITVSANAADNIGVSGVQFKIDGINLGAEDTSPPYSTNWDTSAVLNGSHSVTAVARDSSGNTTTSPAVVVTTSNVVGPGTPPRSHWKFDETSGTTAFDFITAQSNHLTLESGASFTPSGSIAGALSLNGVSGAAVDTLSNGLNSTSNITITARVNPTSLAVANYSTVVLKGADSARGYGLNIFDGNLNFAKLGVGNVLSTVAVPIGAFHHIAVTWDAVSGNVSFYLDGVLSQTVNGAASIIAPLDSDILAIGRYVTSGSFFNGLIDDLRIYNRTLSAPEIAAVADTTPPTVTINSPANGATVSGTVAVSASAADNIGVIGVRFLLDGSALNPEDLTSPYSITFDATPLASGNHTITAQSRDEAGNTTNATITVVANPLPDLLLTALSYSSGSFSATVRNLGNADTPSGFQIQVQFSVDGTPRATGFVSGPLLVGQTVVIPSNPPIFTIPGGTHTVVAFVDYQDFIAESNETNNTSSITVTPAAITGSGVITESPSTASGSGKVDIKGGPPRRPFGTGNVQ